MPPVVVLLIILGIAAFIAILAFGIHRFMNPKMKRDDKPSEEQSVQEELNRVLQPVEDEETAKQINDYKEDND